MTDRPNGTTDGVLTPDGEAVWWFSDTDGDEFGCGCASRSAAGRTSRPRRASRPPTRRAWPSGRDGSAVIGRSTDEDGTTVHLVRAPGAEPVEIYRHRESAGVGDLSRDGR